MSSLHVGGVGSAAWPDREWGVAGRTERVERVDSVKRVVDDPRALGPFADGTARRTHPAEHNPWNPAADRRSVNGYDQILDSLRTAALERDAARAGSANAEPPETGERATKPLAASGFGDAYVRNAIAQYQRNSSLTRSSITP
jgi:hypothetical protein